VAKITLEGDLIECGIEVIAEKGDRLFVVNGQVLAVLGPESGEATSADNAIPASQPRARRARHDSGSRIRNAIMDALAVKPMSARFIGDRNNFNADERGQLTRCISHLCKVGVIERTSPNRYPDYRLVYGGPQVATSAPAHSYPTINGAAKP